VLPVSEKFLEYGASVAGELKAAGFRVDLDGSNEKLGAKIRTAQLQKIPLMLVVGEKEKEASTVSLRKRGAGDQGATPLAQLIEYGRRLENERSLTL